MNGMLKLLSGGAREDGSGSDSLLEKQMTSFPPSKGDRRLHSGDSCAQVSEG
jgi:hypothetical protein